MHSTLCPAEGCGSEGVVTSPNYPFTYPHNLEKTETIQVEQGLIISLEFTDFRIQYVLEYEYNCRDHLTITDGDGTTLLEKSCGNPASIYGVVIGGQEAKMPPAINSSSNTINLVFTTNGGWSTSGWSVSWRAVAGT